MSFDDGFSIEINFLTGRYVATCHNDRRKHEWPPHPARLFSALVAAWADADEPDTLEHSAIEWLESQKPPEISASRAFPRVATTHFVPVNDISILSTSWYNRKAKEIDKLKRELETEREHSDENSFKQNSRLESGIAKKRKVENQVGSVGTTNVKTAKALFPDRRNKQPRLFPSVTPELPRVSFVWDVSISDKYRAVLGELLSRVARLGHSSSLVSCRIAKYSSRVDYVVGDGDLDIRGIGLGQFRELKRRFVRHQGYLPRSLPAAYTCYRKVNRQTTKDSSILKPNTAGTWILFEFMPDSRFLTSTNAQAIARGMRGAIFRHAKNPIHEELSGHRGDGRPTTAPHLAFIPLPFVGSQYADGRLLGIAVSMPDCVSEDARRSVYRAIVAWEDATKQENKDTLQLTLGKHGKIRLNRLRGPTSLTSLNEKFWNESSYCWTSATPIALPKHPGNLRSKGMKSRAKAWSQAEEHVLTACKHVDLPLPISVEVSFTPFVSGAYPIHRFPAFFQKDSLGHAVRRQLLHVAIRFEHRVRGSLILGSGRFSGLGLMYPWKTNKKLKKEEDWIE